MTDFGLGDDFTNDKKLIEALRWHGFIGQGQAIKGRIVVDDDEKEIDLTPIPWGQGMLCCPGCNFTWQAEIGDECPNCHEDEDDMDECPTPGSRG
jgi:hypothetical protein